MLFYNQKVELFNNQYFAAESKYCDTAEETTNVVLKKTPREQLDYQQVYFSKGDLKHFALILQARPLRSKASERTTSLHKIQRDRSLRPMTLKQNYLTVRTRWEQTTTHQ